MKSRTEPKDTPIIFSGAMVRAMMADRKTMTRRLATAKNGKPSSWVSCIPGDRLWVRESWRAGYGYDWHSEALGRVPRPSDMEPGSIVEYMADDMAGVHHELGGKNRSALHMPRWASRLTITLADVRVERLHAISDADALAEGIWFHGMDHGMRWYRYDDAGAVFPSPRDAYFHLWELLHGEDSLHSNPQVVVLSGHIHKANIDKVTA